MDQQQQEVIVVGGGPAGLSAAINAAIRGKRVLLLTAGESILAKAEQVDNYLGLPGVTGREMMDLFTAHAREKGVSITKGRVTNILPMGAQYMLSYGSQVATGTAVILATGTVPKSSVPGEEALLGQGVSYCATCDGMLYRGKEVLVYGLAKDAPEEANYLQGIGVNVIFAAPGARPDDLLAEIPYLQGRLEKISGNPGSIKGEIRLANSPGAPLQELAVAGIFLLREALAPGTLISGLPMTEGHIAADSQMATGLPGLFACGDCIGGPLQVAKAVGEGLVAGQEAAKYVDALYLKDTKKSGNMI